VRLGVDRDQAGNVDPGSVRSGKERANLMHFIDPKELSGLRVGRGAAPDARTRGVGRTMLHEHAVPPANQMS
jgi:hypothetical protein